MASRVSWPLVTGSWPLMPLATSSSAMPFTSRGCRPQKSAICSKVSDVLSTSHTAVALGISGFNSTAIKLLPCRGAVHRPHRPLKALGFSRNGRSFNAKERPGEALCSRREQNLADMVGFGHAGVGGACFSQGKCPVHHRLDPAGLYQRPDFAQQCVANSTLFVV